MQDLKKIVLIVLIVCMFTFTIGLQDKSAILPTQRQNSLFSFYPNTQDVDSSSSPPGPRRPPVTGYSRMPEQIIDLIVEARDSLFASTNRSSAELILDKRCLMTFKEVNKPVYYVTDLKGLKFVSSFILESIQRIIREKIKQGKASTVKRQFKLSLTLKQ